ncbi:hypothetical protein FACS1894199_05410 [Bacteroidia bacterium]|nr:hypothetical protein FACS1894199_05410 [Bacteroidia bacterium]
MKQFFNNITRLTAYNVKIIFGNKFIYFMLSALALYVVTVLVNLFGDEEFLESTAYEILLVPSILVIFYPLCFGIQNDQDAKIIEIIFGIPNYRYKVWLFRLLIAYVICFVSTLLLAILTNWLLVEVPVFYLSIEVMAPALLIGTLSFMFSTIIKNGSGTAVLVIIFGLIFFINSSNLGTSKWNLFLNPFSVPVSTNPIIYAEILFSNRLILLIASVVFLLTGLYKTQGREGFM